MRFHNLLVLLFVIAKAFPSDPVTLNKSDIYSATVSCYSGLLVRENSQVSLYDGQTRIGIAMALKSMRNFNVQFDVTTGPHPRLKFIANGSCEPNISTTANLSLHFPRQQNHVNITVRDTLDSPIVIRGTVGCSHGPIYLNSSIELSETCFLPNYSPRIERTLSPVPVEGSKPPVATYTFYIPRRHETALRNVINVPPYCYITFTHVCHTNETALARVELMKFYIVPANSCPESCNTTSKLYGRILTGFDFTDHVNAYSIEPPPVNCLPSDSIGRYFFYDPLPHCAHTLL
uniref:ZP domain-containing protein n=1 Tax=Panagrellus redivivus TaxID=6233 RepID=A0A7E4VQ22_PANRE